MTDPTEIIRVLVVAEDPLARAGLAALLSSQERCRVVGQAAPQDDLLAEVDASGPAVVLWDLGWEPETSVEHLADVIDDLPAVLALLPVNLQDSPSAGEVWRTGVRGLLSRDLKLEQALAALEAVAAGLVVLDGTLAQPEQALAAGDLAVEELTPRELEVLQLLAEGLPNKTIALRLGISEHTVKYHVNGIMAKLGAQSRTDAVVRAMRLGLILV